jgi:two-component system sensor histidine kinase SenX3
MRSELGSRVAELERSHEAREAILSALEEGIVLFDDTERVLYRNPAAVRQLGGTVESVRDLPSPLRPLAAPNGPDGVDALPIVATGRILQAAAVTVPGEGQRLLVLRDVTRSTQTDAIRRDFVANASHELKTPTASIRALAETISGALGHDDEAVRGFAVRLEREAERLSRLVSDLLDLSRVEGGAETDEQVRFDEVVREEVGRVNERATAAGLTLDVANEGPVWVRGSARDLGLLTRNLVENALQYTGPGGRVSVRVTAVGGGAELSVADTGIGIPARDRERVFERFYRVDRARSRVTGGTGLGLSIVRHVAENLGGSVEVQSELGRGSTFTVRLPLADEDQSTNL